MSEEKKTGGTVIKMLGVKPPVPKTESEAKSAPPASGSQDVPVKQSTQSSSNSSVVTASYAPQTASIKLKTRSQEYAAEVYKKVLAVKDKKNQKGEEDKPFHNKYGGMAHKLPVLIRTSGLMQALAFVESKDEPAWNELIKHLSAVIKQPNLKITCFDADLFEYMRLTRKSMDALVWFKRFAVSVLNIKQGAEADDIAQVEGAGQ